MTSWVVHVMYSRQVVT